MPVEAIALLEMPYNSNEFIGAEIVDFSLEKVT